MDRAQQASSNEIDGDTGSMQTVLGRRGSGLEKAR
jgi:hypothetical protein